MNPFRKFGVGVLVASLAGTALYTSLPASAQGGDTAGNRGYGFHQMAGKRFAQMGQRGGHGFGFGPGGGMARGERLFERFDLDSDGVITEEEIKEGREAHFAAADTNGDGEISLEEFKVQFLDRSQDFMVRGFQFLDKDGDGNVTKEEADLAANRLFGRLDRDGNGVLERVRGQRGPWVRDNDDDDRGPRAQGQQRRGPRADDDDRRGPRAQDDDRGGRRGEGRGPRAESGEGGGPRSENWGRRAGGRGSFGHHHGFGGPARMVLGVFDTDGDGKVTREEFDARGVELFALADTNGSGSFTLEDFGPLWLALNEDRVVGRFQRMDTDGSLGVSAEEHGARTERMMDWLDRNDDGVITDADFKGRGGRKGGKGWHKRG